MNNTKRKEVMDYLTRKPVTAKDYQAALDINALRPKVPMPVSSIEQPETDYQTEVQPDMVVPPQDVLPKGAEPVMPFAPSIPDPQYRQIELAEGGSVDREGFKDGRLVTGFERHNFKPLTKKQREIVKTVYGLKESEVDAWQTDPKNFSKKTNVIRGKVTSETKAVAPNLIKISMDPKDPEVVKEVFFPDEETKKNFLKEAKKKYESPLGRSPYTVKYFANKYSIGERQAARILIHYADKLNLEYPKGISKDQYKKVILKNLLTETSDPNVESYISKKIKREILREQDLLGKIDLAHRVSKQQMKYLGLQFDTRTTGFDSRLINQVIIKPSEVSIENFYKKQRKLIDEIKKNGLTDTLSEQLENINDKIRTEAKKTNGRIIAVTVDPETLEVSFEGKKAKLGLTDKVLDIKEIAEMPIDKRIKFLTNQITPRVQAEIDKGFTAKDFEEILSDPKRKESLIKYAEKYTPDIVEDVKKIIKNPTSTKSLPLYSVPAQVAEAETLLGPMSRIARQGISTYGNVAGGAYATPIGAVLNANPLIERGWDIPSALLFGAGKFLTQDTLNFFLHDLPKARSGVRDTLNQMKDKGETLDDVSISDFWGRVGKNMGPSPFTFMDKGQKFIEENVMDTKKTIDRMIDIQARDYLTKTYGPPRVTDTDIPDSEYADKLSEIKNYFYNQVMSNPEIQNKIDEENLKKQERLSTGPFYMGTEQTQEFAVGGRVNLAEGSDDDLYIPPLEKPEIKKEGVEGLYFGFKEEPRMVPLDETGKPITSGGIRELKKVFSSMLSDSKPEIGYGTEKFNISASKGINPFQGDRDIRYQATYTPEGNVGKFMIDKTPQALGAGYSYQKDGLDLGITGLKNQMGNKSIMLRFGYNYNNGGRVGFQLGGGANFLKMLRNISNSIYELKQSTHMLGSTSRRKGIEVATEEALTPYRGGRNDNQQVTILTKIQNAKEHLPREYHATLDEMTKFAENHQYDKVDDMARALDKVIDPNLRFENLPKDMFPMTDPLNDAFIIIDPEKGHMIGRYTMRTKVNQETGRGTYETFDIWDAENKRFYKQGEEKLKGVESIEKGKEGLN